mgnify:CR=1 FL=1
MPTKYPGRLNGFFIYGSRVGQPLAERWPSPVRRKLEVQDLVRFRTLEGAGQVSGRVEKCSSHSAETFQVGA